MTYRFLPLLLGIAGCTEAGNFLPKVSFDRLEVREIDWTDIQTDFVFRVNNPNPVRVGVAAFDELTGTIDALIDFDGNPVHYVPRLRIRTLAGESIQGVTISDENLGDWILELLHAVSGMGGRGAVTLQAFLTPEGPVFSEINPRFGGGFPLAQEAGGRYPEWILQLLEGKAIPAKIGEYERGLHMTRYFSEEFTRRSS